MGPPSFFLSHLIHCIFVVILFVYRYCGSDQYQESPYYATLLANLFLLILRFSFPNFRKHGNKTGSPHFWLQKSRSGTQSPQFVKARVSGVIFVPDRFELTFSGGFR